LTGLVPTGKNAGVLDGKLALIESATIVELVSAIYRAAYEPTEWAGVIELLRLSLNATHACLGRNGPNIRAEHDVVSTDQDPALL
jgi:hypothetical protein